MANGSTPKLTAQDKEWMAKDDVRTLAEAEKIKSDINRMSAAKKMAGRMAEEAKKNADVLANVANNSKQDIKMDKPKKTSKTKKK